MIPLHVYKNKKVGVFGLGKAGNAAIEALIAGGAEVYAWDDKGVVSGNTDNPQLTTQNYMEWPWESLACVVLSPGVPYTHPKPHGVVERANAANVPIVGEVELLYQECPEATYIGITGTNGKSTTTSLIAHILTSAGREVEVGGNLGVPALQLKRLGKNGIYVIEMSSYQLDLVRSVKFNVAVLLNLTPDHLDRHGDMEGYLKAKLHIFDRQDKNDVAVVGEELLARGGWRVASEGTIIQIGTSGALPNGVCVENGVLHDTATNHQTPFTIKNIPTLQGRHNWQNAAASYAACRAVGLEPEVIYKAMQTYPGLAHRMEIIATINGVKFINDSKATNADATANALAAYDNIYWILGGKAKAGGIESLGKFFPKIKHAFLIGEAQDAFAQTLEGKVVYTKCGTLQKALEEAMKFISSESLVDSNNTHNSELTTHNNSKNTTSIVLLSPACASFDQFKSFEHRGDEFRRLVSSYMK